MKEGSYVIEDYVELGERFKPVEGLSFSAPEEAHQRLAELKATREVSPKAIVVYQPRGKSPACRAFYVKIGTMKKK